LKEDERARAMGKCVPMYRARKRVAGIFISCLGLVIVVSHLICVWLEEGLTGVLEHLIDPSLIFFHSMVFLSIPSFMLIGYFYQKQKDLLENLNQLVEERTRRLNESQTRLKNIFAASPDVITVFDLNGNMIECNQATLDMHEYSSKEKLIGKNVLEFVAKKDRQRVMENLEKTLEKGSVRNIEYTFLTKNGREFPAELSASVIQDSSGTPTGFVAITKDITERKKAGEEIGKVQERFSEIYNSSKDAIGYASLDGVLLDVNDSFCKLTGYSREELLTRKKYQDITPKEYHEYEAKIIERILRTGKPAEYEKEYIRKDGFRVPILLTTFIVKGDDDKPIGLAAIIKDITERKKAEQAIRESQQKFERLFIDNPEAAVYLDPDSHILDVNPRFEELFGYSLDEIKGKHINDVVVPKDKMEEAKMVDKEALKGYFYYHDTVRKRKDGSLAPVSISAAPIIVEGQLIGYVILYKDITERKKAEEALRRSEEQARHLSEFQNKVIDTAVAWIDLLDVEGNVTLWNRAAELISGYSREEVVGHKKIWEWLYPDPEYRAKIFATAKEIIDRGERVENFETTIRCKDGTLKTISWYSNNILDEKGNPAGSIAVGTDITEIKKEQEKVRESEERFRALSEKYGLLLETASEGIGAVDPDENFTFVNRALADMLGYKESELVGMNMRELVPPESFDELLKGTERRKRGESDRYEIVMYRKDGEPRTMLLSCAPLWNVDKTYAGGLGVFTDITEIKKAEERIRESEEKYRNLFESAGDGIITFDLRGRITSANKKIEDISGLIRDEIIGKHFTHFARMGIISLKDIAWILKAFSGRIKGEPTKVYEVKIRNKKGQEKFIEFRGSLIKQRGKPIEILEIIRDVTERKEMEEKLRQYSEHLEELVQKRTEELLESEKRYSVLVEEASDGVLILQDEKIVFSNKKGPEMVGYSRDEIIGLPFENLVNEKYRQHAKERYMRRLRGETVPATIEIEVIAKTGERVPVEIGGTLIHYQGHPADLIIVRDISERKRMEDQRLKLGKLATIGELAAMVGHDLRNPLQAITNASYVINEIVKKMDFAGEKFSRIPPHLRKEMFEEYTQLTKMMNIIDESTNYANKIVSDLRDFARTKEPELTEVDLASLIQETLSDISIPENVRVSIRHDQALSKLYADPTQMRRVFTNLTTNAIQAMPKGGELTISTSLRNGFALIAFQDTGVGIPKKDIKELFTPLFTRKSRGLGLGLPICKNVVEAHGGSIEVESQEGKGSTFTVKLPVNKGGEASGEEGKHPYRG